MVNRIPEYATLPQSFLDSLHPVIRERVILYRNRVENRCDIWTGEPLHKDAVAREASRIGSQHDYREQHRTHGTDKRDRCYA